MRPALDDLPRVETEHGILNQLVVIKLNGGLGTSMGLDRVKSLIPVKGEDTFLDFIARQILYLRGRANTPEPGASAVTRCSRSSSGGREEGTNHLARLRTPDDAPVVQPG